MQPAEVEVPTDCAIDCAIDEDLQDGEIMGDEDDQVTKETVQLNKMQVQMEKVMEAATPSALPSKQKERNF